MKLGREVYHHTWEAGQCPSGQRRDGIVNDKRPKDSVSGPYAQVPMPEGSPVVSTALA